MIQKKVTNPGLVYITIAWRCSSESIGVSKVPVLRGDAMRIPLIVLSCLLVLCAAVGCTKTTTGTSRTPTPTPTLAPAPAPSPDVVPVTPGADTDESPRPTPPNMLTPANVELFAQTGTVLALTQAKLPKDKLANIRDYVDAARGLLAAPNKPDFDGARKLANKLPPDNRMVALAVVDIIEHYIPQVLPKVEGDAATYQQLVGSALCGVVEGIDMYEQGQ